MALKYYPLSRIVPDKYTRGNEYVLANGKNYSGKYYMTYDNKFFTGVNPIFSTGEELFLLKAQTRNKEKVDIPQDFLDPNIVASTITYDSRTRQYAGQLIQLASYVPVPLPSDYSRGYFTRYFAKNISGPGYIIEIEKQDWDQLKNGGSNNGFLSYEIMDMLWQLTGPMYDTRKSQYQIIGGVYTTNKRVTESKQASFRGIVEFIGDEYIKFAKITDMTVATSGSM